MAHLENEFLRRLGAGESIESLCQVVGITRQEFAIRWRAELESRVPPMNGQRQTAVRATVEIERDSLGIPHIYAANDADLFFGFGFAMAQDRLFQLDYLRRKGLGRLAEILGAEGLATDVMARTVGLNRIAAAEWSRLSDEVQATLIAFSSGINAAMESCRDRWPIEFDLLGYQPEPWTPIDSLAIESEFRWYLTGRFPVLVMPEIAKQKLGTGPLLEEFLLAEADEESILQPGEYTPRPGQNNLPPFDRVGQVMNDPDGGVGSNNWVVHGSRSTTGKPLVASDPHIAIEAVSCWYQAHLCGGSFNVAGISYAGMPAIMFGRNEHVAWGITNNICSLRDLYQEKTDAAHPNHFLFDGHWEPVRELTEVIQVRGAEPVTKTIRFSRNGPVVDEVLPAAARSHCSGPVTVKWLGACEGGWLTSLLGMDRAKDVGGFREAVRPWHVPTFSLVFADTAGQIGFHTAGRIPQRQSLERGFRPGWDPQHQWQGVLPFEAMPDVQNPPRGWIATANNRLAPDDYPHLLFGCWGAGWRAKRIREMLESQLRHSVADMGAMQQDAKSLRAVQCLPGLLAALQTSDDPRVRAAVQRLEHWDGKINVESVAATLFNVFFGNWCRAVARERFDESLADFMAAGASGCASRLLSADHAGWFANQNRAQRIIETFVATLSELAQRLGPDLVTWQWGELHRLPLKHVLAGRGSLGELLNHGGAGVRGDIVTVCNTGSAPDWAANTGAGYRLIADLSSTPPTLLAIDAASHSGHPGSAHYNNQFEMWKAGNYHAISLDRHTATSDAKTILRLDARNG